MPASPSRSMSRKKRSASSTGPESVKRMSHRFREARGKVLRLLGQTAHKHDAQFAILWVGPEGRAEVYASEALQGGLSVWLGESVQRGAEERTRAMREARHRREREGLEVLHGGQVFAAGGELFDPLDAVDDMECSGDDQASATASSSRAVVDDADEFLLPVPPSAPAEAHPTPKRPSTASGDIRRDLLTPARSHPAPPASTARLSRSLGPSSSLPALHPSASPNPSPILPSSPFPPSSAPVVAAPAAASTSTLPPRFVRRTFTPDELDAWYVERFNELWHKVDKLVCKSWIKAIEPNKSSRFQYQKGDAHKPDWWPRELRHKEPDHLTKPERLTLLVHLLRRSPVAIDELELATAAMSAHIPQEKMSILHELYRIAKEEKAAIDASPDGKFKELTVALEVEPPPLDDPPSPGNDEPKQHNTRHRARRSIGQSAELSTSQRSPSSHLSTSAQLTPRGSNRLQPYPLARSNSVSDAHDGGAPGLRSPAAGGSGMSRSQSLVGPTTSAGRPRVASGSARRDTVKGALDEADLLGSDPHATPLAARVGARPATTPARPGDSGSPHASEAMGRSFSTSAVGGGSSSSAKKAPRVFDDAVASPAMLKSRSRLSQQHFDQMMHGSSPADKHRAMPRQQPQFAPVHKQPHHLPLQQLPPHFQLHQHHQHQLAQMQAHAAAQEQHQQQQQHLVAVPRPPLQHSHSQPPPPHPHQRPPSHHQQHPPPPQHVVQGLVYGPYSNASSPSLPPPPPQLVRQLSAHSMGPQPGMQPHPHAQMSMPMPPPGHGHPHQLSPAMHQHAHFTTSPHLPQLPPPPHLVQSHDHERHLAQQQHLHSQQQQQPRQQLQHRAAPTQVQVHAGHHQQPHPHPQQHLQQQQQQHPHMHMQRVASTGEYDAYGPPSASSSGAGGPSGAGPGAGAYPTPGYPSPHFAPTPGAGSGSPFLVGGGGGAGAGSSASTPQPPQSAGAQDGFLVPAPAQSMDAYAATSGADYGADEWAAYVDEPLERLGLGLGVGGVDATMGLEPGYYGGEGEDEYGLLGGLVVGGGGSGGGGEADEHARMKEQAEARRRYEEHAFGIVGA
ncbi:hypothetical protein JCM8208_005338 [Rhodotorula glutinis]